MISFNGYEHEEAYYEICSRMRTLDDYHKSLAYLLALDTVCRDHTADIFDFNGDGINPDCIHSGWQTSTSRRTTRLAFNLWNGRTTDGETYIDKNGYEEDLPSHYYAPDEIFACSYAPYYWQAIKLRYPQYTEYAE
jgi:hypothetical protein